MKRFIQRWLGITNINNSTVHKDIFWTEIDIIKNQLDRLKYYDDRIESLEETNRMIYDEDVSAEAQALKKANNDK